MSEIERHVYAVWGVPPETQAYAMAKYSRSSQSMLESIAELSEERTAKFLETFYFAYGLFTVETYCMYERDLVDGYEEPVHLPLEVPLAVNQNSPVTITAVSSWVRTNDCMASPALGERCSYPRGEGMHARRSTCRTTPMTVEPTPQFAPRRVYAVTDVPPEVMAYGMAKCSRSGQGMLESIRELNAQRASVFSRTFCFSNGLLGASSYCMYGRNCADGLGRLIHKPFGVPLAVRVAPASESTDVDEKRRSRRRNGASHRWTPACCGGGERP